MNSIVVFISTFLLLISTSSAQIDWSVKPNNAGGLHLNGRYTQQYENPSHNVAGSVFASGNLNQGKVRLTDKTYGAGVDYTNNGHGLSYQHTRNKQTTNDAIRGTFNVYDNGNSKVNVNTWADRTRFRQKRQIRPINRVDQYGGNVEWINKNGHQASLGINNIPQYNKQTIDLNAKANLWKDKHSSLDVYGGASHNIGKFRKGHTDWNTGLQFKHHF